ncbi:MAG TPA: diaminopimelate decarboxylase, partial [Oligoflexia bacterium]|nr:diaminopimelate decarboxylase [Oligoflexia bacterium]
INRTRRLQKSLEPLEDRAGIRFAVKASSNIHILSLLTKLGCGADIVSGGELFRASLAQIPPDKIVFSGVGKTEEEISRAIVAGIELFNVESLSEVELLNVVAQKHNTNVDIALRFNPNISAQTHRHISTGLKNSKFGLTSDEFWAAVTMSEKLPRIKLIGISCHIGSQITDLRPFRRAWEQLLILAKKVKHITTLDIGGGLGIDYQCPIESAALEDYGKAIVTFFKSEPYKILVEPGRSLVGPTGVLVSKLLHLKKRTNRNIAVLDAGMNDLLRPALYGATHGIFPLRSRAPGAKSIVCDVVGPICESADLFLKSQPLPIWGSDSIYALGCAGAYGMSMASQYNSRGRPPEVLVDRDQYRVIRRRETNLDLVNHEL